MKKRKWSDKEIIEAIKNGGRNKEEEAMRYIFNSTDWRNKAYYFIRKNNGSDITAEEVILESLFEFYKKLKNDTFQIEKSLEAYFLGIVKNLFLSTIKKNKKPHLDKERLAEEHPILNIEDRLISKEENAANKEYIRQIMETIKKMDPKCQEIMKMKIGGYSNKEISAVIKTKTKIKKQVYRCRKKLREKLNKNN